jgi:large subunit ribosomal protein L4
MPKVKIFNTEGKAVGDKNLRDDVFAVAVSPELVHEVMVSVEADARKPYAHTKTRGKVRGGGKKPWRQKGTGRARHGSRRSPIWTGGGITFGPDKNRDYSKKVNRKAKRTAATMLLSDKVANERLVLVDAYGVKDGKTKELAAVLSKLPVEAGKRTVVVSPETDVMLRRSAGNIPGVTLRNIGDLGFMDLLNCQYLVMTADAAEKIEAKYSAVEA